MKSLFEVPVSPCEAREVGGVRFKVVPMCERRDYCMNEEMACKAYAKWLASNYKDVSGTVRLDLRGQNIRTLHHYENHGNTKRVKHG